MTSKRKKVKHNKNQVKKKILTSSIITLIVALVIWKNIIPEELEVLIVVINGLFFSRYIHQLNDCE